MSAIVYQSKKLEGLHSQTMSVVSSDCKRITPSFEVLGGYMTKVVVNLIILASNNSACCDLTPYSIPSC